MRKRCSDHLSSENPPKKKNGPHIVSSINLKSNEFLKDLTGKQWKLGKPVGVGGFGEIYLASDDLNSEVTVDSPFVAKVESHRNGPLFVEVNCYLRIAKPDMIEEWKKEKKFKNLGMPHYVASGSLTHKSEKYRFLILPRYENDLEKVLQIKEKFNLKTVLTISCQIVNVLEYIHSKGYIHSDIKASNILLGNWKKTVKRSKVVMKKFPCKMSNPMRACRRNFKPRTLRNLRPPKHPICYRDISPASDGFSSKKSDSINNEKAYDTGDQIYLLDYGLACKYLLSNGEHRPFGFDERKAHAGTTLFCSRDAHKGVQSRRSDLESLGYNMIYWLTGSLPWIKDVADPEVVAKIKERAVADPDRFLQLCFDFNQYPKFLLDYFQYLQKLQYQEKPDYGFLEELFKATLRQHGYKDDSHFDFDHVDDWGQKCKKFKLKDENGPVTRTVLQRVSRFPLQSNNIPIRPLLRKKVKNKIPKNRERWSQIWIDPEIILKQAREKKHTESNDTDCASNITDFDIQRMNPTSAMIDVFNKFKERLNMSPSYKGDSCLENVDGYTPAMVAVLKRIRERREFELEQQMAVTVSKKPRKKRTNKRRKKESPIIPPPLTRTAKSLMFEMECKVKLTPLRRTYSLRRG